MSAVCVAWAEPPSHGGLERVNDCGQFLVSKSAEVDSKTVNGQQKTAMHCAGNSVINDRLGVVRVLAKSGACVDASDSSGKTPLHLAADQLGTATTLLGASSNIIADNGGRTPLWSAVNAGNLACCSLLVARGADAALRDTQGKSALSTSLAGPPSTEVKREAVMVMKLLVDLGRPIGDWCGVARRTCQFVCHGRHGPHEWRHIGARAHIPFVGIRPKTSATSCPMRTRGYRCGLQVNLPQRCRAGAEVPRQSRW